MKISTMFLSVPLIVVPLIAYSFALPLGPIDTKLFSWTTPAGDVTQIRRSDCIVLIAIFCLIIEVVKATSMKAIAMVDHLLSVAALLVMALLYFNASGFGTAPFLTLVFLQAFDVVAGVWVSIRVARRDFSIPGAL
jgi:hypothetical protein